MLSLAILISYFATFSITEAIFEAPSETEYFFLMFLFGSAFGLWLETSLRLSLGMFATYMGACVLQELTGILFFISLLVVGIVFEAIGNSLIEIQIDSEPEPKEVPEDNFLGTLILYRVFVNGKAFRIFKTCEQAQEYVNKLTTNEAFYGKLFTRPDHLTWEVKDEMTITIEPSEIKFFQ